MVAGYVVLENGDIGKGQNYHTIEAKKGTWTILKWLTKKSFPWSCYLKEPLLGRLIQDRNLSSLRAI